MRTILIDPAAKSFTEIEYNGDWRTISDHLDCDLFDIVYTDFGDVYVDDEGLLKPQDHFFLIEGVEQPLAGKGLLFGPADGEGNSTAAQIGIEELEKKVRFLTRHQVMAMFT
jgi:hypothetical protein